MPRLTIGTGRALLGGNDDPAWVSLLQANATYAWASASGLTLATWTDVKAGVVATAGGTGTSIGTLNGKPTAVFNGSGRYRTAAFAAGSIVQPYAVVVVASVTNVAGDRAALDGISPDNRGSFAAGATTALLATYRAGATVSTRAGVTWPLGTAAVAVASGGTTPELRINGVGGTGSVTGASGISGATIGAAVNDTAGWLGSIADVIIVAGADYAARAAVIEAAALVRYRI